MGDTRGVVYAGGCRELCMQAAAGGCARRWQQGAARAGAGWEGWLGGELLRVWPGGVGCLMIRVSPV